MKNAQNIRIHLTGDVYMQYTVSAETLSEGEHPSCTFEMLTRGSEQFEDLKKQGLLCFPDVHRPVVTRAEGHRCREANPNFFVSGERTIAGVVSTVKVLADYLAETAQLVWENIDPRCGAKVPSRLYRNVAYVCADALTHLGIPAKVALLALDPEKHNGLKNQYRVVVDATVPRFPWKEVKESDPENPEKSKYHPVLEYENLNFDFDVTNALRTQWVWPDSSRVLGEDVRVLRNGRPVRWVDSLYNLTKGGYSHFTVVRGSQTPMEIQGDGELLLRQTSLLSVLAEVSDGTPDGMMEALNKMFNSPSTKSTAKSHVARMNLG